MFKNFLRKLIGLGWLESKIVTVLIGGEEKQYLDFKRGAVNFSLITNDDHIILCRQERPTTGDKICDACFGGYIDKGETPTQALIRECYEETNVDISERDIEWVYTDKIVSAGYTNERNSLAIVNLPITKDAVMEVLHCNDVKEGIEFKVQTVDDFMNRTDLDLLKIEAVRLSILGVL